MVKKKNAIYKNKRITTSRKKNIKSKPSAPKKRNFLRTKTFKRFNKKVLKNTDVKYKEQIKKFWNQQYNIKGQSAKDVLMQSTKKFVRDTRNRFYKTKKEYTGLAKGHYKNGKWIKGKPRKRKIWRDKLKGDYLKHKQIGVRLLQAMQPDLIKSFMQKKGIKNYQKARKLYLKQIKNKSLGKVMELYSTSP